MAASRAVRHAGVVLAVLTLAPGVGSGCSRVDNGDVIGLDVRFDSASSSQPKVTLNVSFVGYEELQIDLYNWTDLTQPRLMRFVPPDLHGDVMVTVSSMLADGPYDSRSMSTALGQVYGVVLTRQPPDAGVPPVEHSEGGTDTPPPPDAEAGMEAGPETAMEAGMEAGPEIHPTDCDSGDGATEPLPPGVTCGDYCNFLVPNCGTTLAVGLDACLNTCVGLGWDKRPAMADDKNTLVCRKGQAESAFFEPSLCPSAWFTPSGECGGSCDAFCDAGAQLCTGTALFNDAGTCRSVCNGSLTADLMCRIGALADAGLHPSNQVVDCMKASIAANGCM